MKFDIDNLLESMTAKANTKLEEMRHAYAQSFFDCINEEFFVYDKEEDEVIGGPYATKDRAYKTVDAKKRKSVEVLSAKELEDKYGILN